MEKSSKKRREKRKDLERYDVRTLIAEKPRRKKDKFGRDLPSPSHSSASFTPPSQRRSLSKEILRESSQTRGRSKKRRRSRDHKSLSRSISRSLSRTKRSVSRRLRSISRSRRSISRERMTFSGSPRRRSKSRNKKRQREKSEEKREKRKKSRDKKKKKKRRGDGKSRSRSISPKMRRDWERKRSRGRSHSIPRSVSPSARNPSPSWTPPHFLENVQNMRPHNLTVILANENAKKKRDKKKKEKRISGKEVYLEGERKKRKKGEKRSNKEVFASGDNILVSVSFDKENESREIGCRDVSRDVLSSRDSTSKRKRDAMEEMANKRIRKEKEKKKEKRKIKNKAIAQVKPVAIIDLDRSPFKELTPSPKNVIVLTDSENDERNEEMNLQTAICDSSQQVVSPERPMSPEFMTGEF